LSVKSVACGSDDYNFLSAVANRNKNLNEFEEFEDE